jgi:hypothetical protein
VLALAEEVVGAGELLEVEGELVDRRRPARRASPAPSVAGVTTSGFASFSFFGSATG